MPNPRATAPSRASIPYGWRSATRARQSRNAQPSCAAALEFGPAIRLIWRETAADAFFSEQSNMGIEFLVEVTFATATEETPEQPVPGATQSADHALTPFSAMKRATISVAWAHWVTSEASCFWPALVIR